MNMIALEMSKVFYHFQILLLEGQCQLVVVNARRCSYIQWCGAPHSYKEKTKILDFK